MSGMRPSGFLPIFFLIAATSSGITSCKIGQYNIDGMKAAKYLTESESLKQGHAGLAVYDLSRDTMLFRYNAEKRFIPASNTKLLTWYAAMEMVEDSIPAMEYCVVNDSLFFTGTGDPTWFYREYRHDQSLLLLLDTAHSIHYIARPMADTRFGPGWAWDDFKYSFSVEKSSFPIYGNRVSLKRTTDGKSIKIQPNSMQHLVQIKDSESRYSRISREEFSNDFYVNLPIDGTSVNESIPFIYSDEIFINALADTLNRTIQLASKFPPCNRIRSYDVPTDSVLARILLDSDNFLAEQMLLVLSSMDEDSLSSRKVIDFLLKNQLAEIADEITWVDGSGLSRYNLLSPESLVNVLKKIYSKKSREEIFSMLPESGRTGTLKYSFRGLAGKVYAKTGSMQGVYNLSGYLVTKTGRVLVFSFMNNNFNTSQTEVERETENILSALSDY